MANGNHKIHAQHDVMGQRGGNACVNRHVHAYLPIGQNIPIL